MKYVLTVSSDDPNELIRLMSSTANIPAAGVAVAHNYSPTTTIQPTNGDDADDAPNTAAPAFDSAGLPWDGRIHAATKAVVKDGTWRKMRGVDPAVVAAVEAELRARNTPPHVAGTGMAAPYNPNTAAPQAYIAPPAPGPAFNPNQPAAAPAYVAPVQQPVGMPFGEFMQRLQVALQPGGTMTQTDLQAYQTAFGIADLQPLAVDPEKCLTFYKYLRDNGKIG